MATHRRSKKASRKRSAAGKKASRKKAPASKKSARKKPARRKTASKPARRKAAPPRISALESLARKIVRVTTGDPSQFSFAELYAEGATLSAPRATMEEP